MKNFRELLESKRFRFVLETGNTLTNYSKYVVHMDGQSIGEIIILKNRAKFEDLVGLEGKDARDFKKAANDWLQTLGKGLKL